MNANDIPLPWAAVLGIVIGLLLYGPLSRWLVTFVRALRERRRRRGAQRAGAGALLVIFATLHPAPWLLLLGLPYGVYALWSDPLRVLWATLAVGAILGAAAVAIIATLRRRDATAAHRPLAAGPDT